MPEYTVLTVVAVLVTIALELLVFRTGIFRTAQYWLTMLIVFSFQVLVDGWLTKLSAPIVIYHPDQMLGVRFPWDVPIEDYGFGFAMVTLTILVWRWLLDRPSRVTSPADEPAATDTAGDRRPTGEDRPVR